jgi:hypothetical protein
MTASQYEQPQQQTCHSPLVGSASSQWNSLAEQVQKL